MFTGLVEEMGIVQSITLTPESCELTISAQTVLDDVTFGASICVNGVCLSVTEFGADWFKVGLAPETRRVTSLEALQEGSPVNLERSVLPTTRLGGHYVQGHVDGTGHITVIQEDGDALNIRIRCAPDLMNYIVRKGYICVDGTSLTVVETGDDWFSLTLISHTQQLVTLGQQQVGDIVNLEVDIMAKYAEKILTSRRDA